MVSPASPKLPVLRAMGSLPSQSDLGLRRGREDAGTLKSMKILITGATGFLGRRLVPSLASAGSTVTALSRDAARARDVVPALSDAWNWSPLTESAPANSLEGADAVVHLMGENVAGRWTKTKREAIRASRRDGTRNLVEALGALPAEQRPRVLVSASAVGFYGDRGETELTEDMGSGDDFLAEVCQEWEQEAEVAAALGVRVVRMRLPILLHPDGGALERMLPIARTGVSGALGGGNQWWCWVSVRDVLRFVHDAVHDDSFRGAYNVCSPMPERQRDFAKTLALVVGRPAFIPTPAFVLKLALGGFSTELLTSKRQIPARLTERGWEFADRALEPTLQRMLG